jgi:hypothetical protein
LSSLTRERLGSYLSGALGACEINTNEKQQKSW